MPLSSVAGLHEVSSLPHTSTQYSLPPPRSSSAAAKRPIDFLGSQHMKILSWVQARINGSQEKKKTSGAAPFGTRAAQEYSSKEEFSDWPQGLLAIGTFGGSELQKQSSKHEDFENPHPLQDLPQFTLEDVNKLEKELEQLLSLKPKWEGPGKDGATKHDLDRPFFKSPDCPSRLEGKSYRELGKELERLGEDDEKSSDNKVIYGKAKDMPGDNKRNGTNMRRKSTSFILKKLLFCRTAFASAPSLREPISETRMEKFLKIVLQKKIYPQSTSAPTTVKKYLEEKQVDKAKIRDKILMMTRDMSRENSGKEYCKWVKTDSEYIVLEI